MSLKVVPFEDFEQEKKNRQKRRMICFTSLSAKSFLMCSEEAW